MLMHSGDSHRKGRPQVFYTVCASPGLHWSLASGLKRKAMCMLKTDGEFKLLLTAAEREILFSGEETRQHPYLPLSALCPAGGTSFELIQVHFSVPPKHRRGMLCFHGRLRFLDNAYFRPKILM